MTRPRAGLRRYAVTLPLEALAGAYIVDVAEDMIAAAKRFEMPVTLDMNGAHLIAFPNTSLTDIRRDYEAQLAARGAS